MAEEKVEYGDWRDSPKTKEQVGDVGKYMKDLQKSIETIPQHTSEIPLRKNTSTVEKTKSFQYGTSNELQERSLQRHKSVTGVPDGQNGPDKRFRRPNLDIILDKLDKDEK